MLQMYGILYVIVTFDTKHDKRRKLDCQTDKKTVQFPPFMECLFASYSSCHVRERNIFLARELTWQFKNCSLERQGKIRHEETTMHDIYKQLWVTTIRMQDLVFMLPNYIRDLVSARVRSDYTYWYYQILKIIIFGFVEPLKKQKSHNFRTSIF